MAAQDQSKYEELAALVRADYRTTGAVANEMDWSEGHASRTLKEAVEAGVLDREKKCGEYHYRVTGETDDADESEWDPSIDADLEGMRVLNQEVNPRRRVPTGVPQYYQADDEYDRLRAMVAERHTGAGPTRVLLGGPTGCGKTIAAMNLAQDEGFAFFKIQGQYALNSADLLGMTTMIGDETGFIYGKLPQALRTSREHPTVLLVDEVNRIREDAKGVFYSVFESNRCEVTIEQRAGETVRGDPENLIVIGTMNEGAAYNTRDMDLAERRRFAKIDMGFLGREDRQQEIDLVVERTPACETLAEIMVEMANEVRKGVEKGQLENVKRGIPTGLVIEWAQKSYAYSKHDIDNPVYQAAHDTILRPFYDKRQRTYDTVREAFKSNVQQIPFEKNRIKAWENRDIQKQIRID